MDVGAVKAPTIRRSQICKRSRQSVAAPARAGAHAPRRVKQSLKMECPDVAATCFCLHDCDGPLIIITSPYARKGEGWDVYRRHYGPQGDPLILVAQGASRDFNPTLSGTVVQRALERDNAAGSAEYLA